MKRSQGEIQAVLEHVESRPELSVSDVWGLLKEGCNPAEIGTYAKVSKTVARAMCAEAIRQAHRP
jgi:hypothetical protein